MWCARWMVLAVLAAVCVTGCSGPEESSQAAEDAAASTQTDGGQDATTEGPAAAVGEFLDAMRTGNDDKTASLMTETARKTAAEMNLVIAPSGSDTARFEVGEVEWLADDGARVSCTWTDLDQSGQPTTEEAVLMVRREGKNWRVAGLAYKVFPDKPPLLLNFEDPEDLRRKQQWVREEVLRRTRATDSQAHRARNPENSPLR